jgi:UDP-N-acetylmuramoyl-tripeptide--D-alanyl-D-alanine ligase
MMQLSQAASLLDARLIGDDVMFNAVSKDTRTIHSGDLYVALKGERFDGHAFVAQAADAGAVAALVSDLQNISLPQLQVTDTRLALGKLAAGWRRQFSGKLAAITGSNGKTTVKEMCRSILAHDAGDEHVLSTQGNLNNDIGMPLTLLSLRADHRFAVIEMGANHVGEIDYLTRIAEPDVALVNNAAAAHLEGFGSIENVARAKAEIYSGLKPQGIAVINLDDNFAPLWLNNCRQHSCRTFSLDSINASVHTSELRIEADACHFILHVDGEQQALTLPLPGQHNVMNALAATAVCSALGVSINSIAAALSGFVAVGGRLNIRTALQSARLIDDTYNANPRSFHTAMQVLVSMPGQHWMAMGDMGELGADAAALHAELGVQAKALGITRLFATGAASRAAVTAFGEGASWFADHASLTAAVKTDISADVVLLVKGSRFMAMEQVVNGLLVDTDNNNKKRSDSHREVN